jgi:hypothetical protein
MYSLLRTLQELVEPSSTSMTSAKSPFASHEGTVLRKPEGTREALESGKGFHQLALEETVTLEEGDLMEGSSSMAGVIQRTPEKTLIDPNSKCRLRICLLVIATTIYEYVVMAFGHFRSEFDSSLSRRRS